MFMSNVVEQSFNIAWGFLLKSGEIRRADATANMLFNSIRSHMKVGERRPLMLANHAIDDHRRDGSPMEKPTPEQLAELKRLSTLARTNDWSEIVRSREEAETRIRDLKEKARME